MGRRGSNPNAALASAERDVDELVRELRAIYYGTGIELMLRVGKLVLERLYGDDKANWQSRSRKDVSFRRLQTHPELPFKASMLSRAVAIYVLSRRRTDLLRFQNVSQTHLQEVLNLPARLQDDLIECVEREKWSVRRLRAEVGKNLAGVSTRAGRPRAPAFSRQLRHLRSIVDGRLLVTDFTDVDVLQLQEAQDLFDIARRLCQQAEQAARILSAHLEGLKRLRAEIAPDPARIAAPTGDDSESR